jgi:hypothetical protein
VAARAAFGLECRWSQKLHSTNEFEKMLTALVLRLLQDDVLALHHCPVLAGDIKLLIDGDLNAKFTELCIFSVPFCGKLL